MFDTGLWIFWSLDLCAAPLSELNSFWCSEEVQIHVNADMMFATRVALVGKTLKIRD